MMEPRGLLQPSRGPRGLCDAFSPSSNTALSTKVGVDHVRAFRAHSVHCAENHCPRPELLT